MSRAQVAVAVVAVSLAASAAAEEQPRTAISSTVVVKVSDRNKAADLLVAEADKINGYFSSRADDYVTFKIPVAQAKAFLAKVEPLGKVINREMQAQDIGARLEELKTRLKSRQQVFDRYFSVLSGAGPGAVVEVEAEMTQLVTEIEGLQGQIRLIEHQLQYAEITVRFEFRDRRPPERSGSSSFAWLNTMNLVDLMQEFAHE
jgi:hypothetical protein